MKTLLTRAMAGEAKTMFFSCAASEFVELFVGSEGVESAGLVREGQVEGVVYCVH